MRAALRQRLRFVLRFRLQRVVCDECPGSDDGGERGPNQDRSPAQVPGNGSLDSKWIDLLPESPSASKVGLVKELPGSSTRSGRRPVSAASMGGILFFVLCEPEETDQDALYVTDGTRSGTKYLGEFVPGSVGFLGIDEGNGEELLLLSDNDSVHGNELWRTKESFWRDDAGEGYCPVRREFLSRRRQGRRERMAALLRRSLRKTRRRTLLNCVVPTARVRVQIS